MSRSVCIVTLSILLATTYAIAGLGKREVKALEQIGGHPAGVIRAQVVINGDGTPEVLDSFEGRVTIVSFWATWCPPCLDEMPLLQKAHREGSSKGLRVVGVTTWFDEERPADEELAEVRKALEARGVSYPVLVTPGQEDWNAYRVDNLPVTVLVGPDGLPHDYAMGVKGLRRLLGKAEALLDVSE